MSPRVVHCERMRSKWTWKPLFLSLFLIQYESCCALLPHQSPFCAVSIQDRKACGSMGGAHDLVISNRSTCEVLGCCFAPLAHDIPVDVYPRCFEGGAAPQGYTVSIVSVDGSAANLSLSSNASYSSADMTKTSATAETGNEDIPLILVTSHQETATRTRVTFADPRPRATEGARRLRAAMIAAIPNLSSDDGKSDAKDANEADVAVQFSDAGTPFTFRTTFTDKRAGEGNRTLVIKSSPRLVMREQYVELTLDIFATGNGGDDIDRLHLFGVGESTRRRLELLPGERRTLWARDEPSFNFDTNTYGSHPLVLVVQTPKENQNAQAFGFVVLTTYGMDVEYRVLNEGGVDEGGLRRRLAYKILGGGERLDLYFFAGPSPTAVVAQYTTLVGKPAMMPYWSLGYHNCRWGYSSTQEVREVVQNYSLASIPLEAAWTDIDYMDSYYDFTLGAAWSDLGVFADELHKGGQRWVPILDPGIAIPADGDSPYTTYEEGLVDNIFLRDLTGKALVVGSVWPGPVHYPDWLHPNTTAWWTRAVGGLYHGGGNEDQQQPAHFDGLWIDMNEASNFVTGQVCSQQPVSNTHSIALAFNKSTLNCTTIDPTNRYDNPPFAIDNGNGRIPIGHRTIAASAQHYATTATTEERNKKQKEEKEEDDASWLPEYAVHNLHGLLEARATAVAATAARDGKRPFVLSRSTFAGSGNVTAHWTGDNAATWRDLQASIVAISALSIQGLTMVGPDQCGFEGDTTEELCARWVAAGAFMPFSRVHNAKGFASQELYRWGTNSIVAVTARRALGLRYRLLPHIYTLFFEAHTGETRNNQMVAAPLFLQFPDLGGSYLSRVEDQQFMLGANLLVAPVTQQNATKQSVWFPGDEIWWRFEAPDPTDNASFVISMDTWSILEPLPVVCRTTKAMQVEKTSSLNATARRMSGQKDSKLRIPIRTRSAGQDHGDDRSSSSRVLRRKVGGGCDVDMAAPLGTVTVFARGGIAMGLHASMTTDVTGMSTETNAMHSERKKRSAEGGDGETHIDLKPWTTDALRQSAYDLLIPLDEMGTATGELFLDDGDQPRITGDGAASTVIRFATSMPKVSLFQHGNISVTVHRLLSAQDIYQPAPGAVWRHVIVHGLAPHASVARRIDHGNHLELKISSSDQQEKSISIPSRHLHFEQFPPLQMKEGERDKTRGGPVESAVEEGELLHPWLLRVDLGCCLHSPIHLSSNWSLSWVPDIFLV